MLHHIHSLVRSLNANSHPGDIAHGFCLGLLLALMPKDNLLWFILFIFTIFIRINKGIFFLTLIFLGFLAPFCDVIIHKLGFWLLSLEFLQPTYKLLYNTPIIGATKFNNTMVAGGLLLGLILYIPCYIFIRVLVKQYRKAVQPKFANLHDKKSAGLLGKIPILRHLNKISSIKEFFGK